MRETTSPAGALRGGGAAASFMLALLLACGGVAMFARHEAQRLPQVERLAEQTAVADTAFFQMPAGDAPVTATFRGQTLQPVSRTEVKRSDSKMLKAGLDGSGNFFVYVQRGEPQADNGFYFLRTAPGRYLQCRAAAPGAPPE